MLFRLSQKLNAKIKAGTLATLPLDENPFADWSAGLFLVGRSQHILLRGERMSAAGIDDGYLGAQIALLMQTIRWAKESQLSLGPCFGDTSRSATNSTANWIV